MENGFHFWGGLICWVVKEVRMNRPVPLLVFFYCGGILLGERLSAPLPVLYAASFIAGVLTLRFSKEWLIWLLLFLVGWTNYLSRTAVLSPYDLRQLIGERARYVTVGGELSTAPVYREGEEDEGRSLVEVRVRRIRGEEGWEWAYGKVVAGVRGKLEEEEYYAGRSVEVTGVLMRPGALAAEGCLDYRKHLRLRGIYYLLNAGSVEDWKLTDSGGSPPAPQRFRAWAQRSLARGLGEDEIVRLLWAMVLGWRTGLAGEVRVGFMRSGTLHVFAISGLHVAIVSAIMVAALRLIQVPRGFCGVVVIPALWFYTAATGWQSSAVRASVMMSIIIAGWSLRRPPDLFNSLSVAGLAILLWEPEQIFQAGFQLSFCVVLSLALIGSLLKKHGARWLERDPMLPRQLVSRWKLYWEAVLRWLIVSFSTSVAAWLGSLPLIAHYFHLITPVSLLVNVVIVHLSGFVLLGSFASLICAGWWPGLGEIFSHSAWFGMRVMVWVSEWGANLPGAYCYVPGPSLGLVLVYYGVLTGTLSGWLFARKRRIWSGLILLVLVLGGGWHWQNGRGQVRITVLPVGGDAIFVDRNGGAEDLLIDVGTESAAKYVVGSFLRGQGVNRLSNMLLTHGDLQHVGGAEWIWEEFGTKKVMTSPVPFRSAPYRRLIGQLELAPEKWGKVSRGDRVCGWEVLHPEEGDKFSRGDDGALVLRGEFFGVRVLLVSDLGKLGQRTLFDREKDLRADVVVTGMPSPDEPLEEGLLEAISPRAIVVSCAEFPIQARAKAELRERLEGWEVPVFYTSDVGAVTIRIGPKGWEIRDMRWVRRRFAGNRDGLGD